jgi:hypothetical protein
MIVLKVDFAMHFFVHGFFGKFAKQATETRDVVETTIANDTINNVLPLILSLNGLLNIILIKLLRISIIN